MSAIVNLTIRDNADFVEAIKWVDTNGDPYNLTGNTFKMDVRASANAASAEVTLTTDNGGINSTDLENGTITINVADGAISPGSYVYDLIKITTASGQRVSMMYGTFTVVDGVTV